LLWRNKKTPLRETGRGFCTNQVRSGDFFTLARAIAFAPCCNLRQKLELPEGFGYHPRFRRIQGYPVLRSGVPQLRPSLRKWGLVMLAAAAFSGSLAWGPAWSRNQNGADTALQEVPLSALPAQAQSTQRLIRAGGPFPYEKDGSVFRNRERLLPARERGLYREYTVPTPGSRDRGARRIVCGGEPPTNPEVCYYTADHYASFRRIVFGR
jgi:ribonuclease T1